MSTFVVIALIVFALGLEIFLARLAMKDARTKGLNPILWGTVVFFTTFLGYLCYRVISSRKAVDRHRE